MGERAECIASLIAQALMCMPVSSCLISSCIILLLPVQMGSKGLLECTEEQMSFQICREEEVVANGEAEAKPVAAAAAR